MFGGVLLDMEDVMIVHLLVKDQKGFTDDLEETLGCITTSIGLQCTDVVPSMATVFLDGVRVASHHH